MMLSSNNNTLGAQSFPMHKRDLYIITTLYAMISLASILGNGLVLLAFFKSSKIRNSRTNYLIVSLSCADLITGCFAIPLYTYFMLINFKGYNNDPAYFVYQAIDIFSVAASIWHLAFISIERYLAILFPVIHHIATPTAYFSAILALWLVSVLSGGLSVKLVEYKEKYVTYNNIFLYGIPLVIIGFSYISILYTTLRRSYVTSRRTFERELKVSCTIFILISLFLICWSPFFIVSTMTSYCRCISIETLLYFKALHFATSCVNPVVYAARIPDFRVAFTKVLPKQIISFVFCLFHKTRRESPPNSRSRTCSTLSSTVAMVPDTSKDSRRRPTLLENKAAVDQLIQQTPKDTPPLASSVTSNKFVSFASDSPSSSIVETQLTNV